MEKKCFILLYSICFFLCAKAQIRYADKIRYQEVIKISKVMGDNIWIGFSEQPFPMLFIYDSVEYLVNHPNPPADYKVAGFDTVLNLTVYKNKRTWPPVLLACAPINNYPTLLASTPEALKTGSSTWIIKLLHERFHQNQFFDSLLRDLNALKLKVTDATFPYDSPKVNERYKNYRNSLAMALENLNNSKFRKSFKNYIKQKRKFKKCLSNDEYQYFSLMLWMEGISRYTEFKFLEQLRNYYIPASILWLKDFIPFSQLEEKKLAKEHSYLKELDLNVGKKNCWYTIGYAEGILLDKVVKNWRLLYPKKKFNIDQYYKKGIDHSLRKQGRK